MKILKEQGETYKELEQALGDGKSIQLCVINAKGKAVHWHDADKVNRNFAPNRYRIIEYETN